MKRINIRKLFFRCFLLFMIANASDVLAQSSTVTGKISTSDGEVLPYVNVLQKGTGHGVVADIDGKYSIKMNEGEQILVFSYVGFDTKEVQTKDRSNINVILNASSENLDKVVVVGYAKKKRKNILGAVSSIDDKEIRQTTPVNAFDAIQGRLAGVNIQTNGGPGEGSDITIRGVSTFNAGTGPLYVVDGQQVDNIDNIDPSVIASIEVLKDGAAAAIYGSRSANGVVIITTKTGKAGKTKIDVNYSRGYSFVNSHVPVANTKERVKFVSQRRGSSSTSLTGSQRDSLSLMVRNSIDLQDLLFRGAYRDQINVAFSGGSETGNFYWNTGFLNEEGTVINSKYKRFNTQFKINADLFDFLKTGTSTYISYDLNNGPSDSRVFRQLVQRVPYFPIFEPDGSYTPTLAGRRNPIAEANVARRDNRNFRARTYNYLEARLLPQLKFRSTFSIDFRLRKQNSFEPIIIDPYLRNPHGSQSETMDYNLLQENFLTYDQSFGDHNVSAILGNSWQKWTRESSQFHSNLFLFDEIQTFNGIEKGGLLQNGTDTRKSRHALIGYFAQASYNYKERYLVDGVFRRDGSSRVGAKDRFGNFKSFSVGWRPSSEPFLKSADWLSDLLLKFSYGENGNQAIGNYDNQQTYNPGYFYEDINGVAFSSRLGNQNLQWENTVSKNFGANLKLFKGRFNASVNYYIKTTKDLLATVSLPAETGFSDVRTNIGSVENKGIEISVSGTPLQTENFSWFTSFNFATLDNKVLDVANKQGFFDEGIYRIQEGEPIGNMFIFKDNGIFKYDESNAFTDDGAQLTPNFGSDGNFTNYTLNGQEYSGNVNQKKRAGNILKGGDVNWDDVDGDFVITDKNDRQILGNGLVNYFGGFFNEFTYKNFTLSFLFNYNFGNDIFRAYDQARNDESIYNQTPSPDLINNSWYRQGDDAKYAITDRSRSYDRLLNSKYIDNGDFIKLNNIKFSFNFPQNTLDRIGFIDAFSINLSVNNVATWTNYTGYNPELGSRGNPLEPGYDNLRYPKKSEFILGLRLRM